MNAEPESGRTYIGPGDVVLIPPDVPHRGEAVGPEDAVYLEVLSPVEDRYRAVAAVARSNAHAG
jgi:quercetin dioxygenase-like cupin family protein